MQLAAALSTWTLMILILGCAMHSAPSGMAAGSLTVVYVVRHAEKLDPADRDSPLSSEGHERAKALDLRLAESGIQRIYATTLQRTGQTVEPLAERLGLRPVLLDPFATDELVERIRTEDLGKVVLVAGHTNTIQGLIKALSGLEVESIPEERYDRLFKVALSPDGRNAVEELRYGASTP